MEIDLAQQPRVGFIGLGNMGAHMARNLLADGYELTVFDLRTEAGAALVADGAAWADSPRGVGEASDVTFVALPGPTQVDAVATGGDGVLAGLRPGSYLIDVSTNNPLSIRRIAEVAANKGVSVLDAPLSGGVRGARLGTLTIMVGGDTAAFEACLPLLRVVGENILHMGPLGSGHVTKLVNNFMGISNAVASMEAMTIGTAAGVDPERLLEAVNLGTGTSHMTRTLYPYLIFKRSFDPVRFSMELAVKDLDLALEIAKDHGLTIEVGKSAHAALTAAIADGLAGADMSKYITVLEAQAGVTVSEHGKH
jgi:3-hydroxyisobutyrate dehydrogenase-like beta-hydroxyacid dehydrogenase